MHRKGVSQMGSCENDKNEGCKRVSKKNVSKEEEEEEEEEEDEGKEEEEWVNYTSGLGARRAGYDRELERFENTEAGDPLTRTPPLLLTSRLRA
ncbi:hypothetical protein Pmani_017168 [Petrolisthes manimaculis]|uniref:Uncharacterized protein n=1 Tax=Petrolisthes manimaculis TaxID=1843537 RepID=A0AAE1PMB6_9EUCA|nr:hypothetical protein Pmani_017168 [Petrolisthes manimaculis]